MDEPLRYRPPAGRHQTTPLFPGQFSLRGSRWMLRQSCERTSLTLMQRFGLSSFMADILTSRNIALDEIEGYLNPTLQALLPDPFHLKDMDKAVERVKNALLSQEIIYLFGDYDVDGATSTALLYKFLKSLGGDVYYYIPDRLQEGYGPNPHNLKKIKDKGASLVVTLDCGATALEALTAAKTFDLDVVVLDHHIGEAELPPAIAVVNPNRQDETSKYTYLAAVGVTFLFVIALKQALKDIPAFMGKLPDVREYLDLVALGTVADVVPLINLNRALVRQGLKVWNMHHNIGLSALGEVAGLDKAIDTYALGFIFGPRINAGGRVGQADLGIRLLTTDNISLAKEIAHQLNQFNQERQEIEKGVLQEALAKVQKENREQDPFICLWGEGWHPGVIGIVASRLKDLYHKPTFIISVAGDQGKGSGRSVTGVDLGSVVHGAKENGLLMAGGGHAMAAGITVATDKLEEFRHHLIEHVQDKDLTPELIIDASISTAGVVVSLVDSLQHLHPLGTGNPAPKFLLKNVTVVFADVVGENHIRCQLKGEEGVLVQAIAFRALGHPHGDFLLLKSRQFCHVAGTLQVDSWNGRQKIQFIIDDVMVV